MTAFAIQEVARRSGLSEPTLRYYEQVGLVGPVARDDNQHRRYGAAEAEVTSRVTEAAGRLAVLR